MTPDPSFLFLTRRHQEALMALYYGVHRRKGFVALTGDVGTGKTLLIRCLLRMLKDSEIACAYVFNSRLSTLDFLHYVRSEEHTSELQSQSNLVCRLLLEKKKIHAISACLRWST